MRLSYDNNFLFTSGQDGALIISDVKEKDLKGGLRREGVGLPYSDEILTEKQEIEQYINEKEGLENEFNNTSGAEGVDTAMKLKRLEDAIAKLQEEQ